MKTVLLLFFTILVFSISFAQVGIGNTDPDVSSLLDIRDGNKDKGILIPRVDIADLNTAAPITSPIESLLVYNENTTTGTGFYYWDGAKWTRVAPIRIDDLEDGKSDVDESEDGSSIFLGIGAGAADDASDNRNIGIGYQALENVVGTNATSIGQNNTAIGYRALRANTDGNNNIAIGQTSLVVNTTGKSNVAIGNNTLNDNISGESNVAVGISSQSKNINGINNTSIGSQSLRHNASGNNNTALGDYALRGSLATGALGNAGSSSFNTAIGNNSLQGHETGDNNVAVGNLALQNNIIGSGNIALGNLAGQNETGSNKLYIDNSNTTNPLIYGDFDTNSIRINGVLDITTGVTVATGGVTVDGGGVTINNNAGITVNAGGIDVTAGGVTTNAITVGTTGTEIREIIKTTITRDVGIIAGRNRLVETFTVVGASNASARGATVYVSPSGSLPNGVVIAYAYVSSNDVVTVVFGNYTNSDKNPASRDYHFTIIEN